ncbi:pirin family protein, partial [Planctobacterium marinum]
MHILSKRPAQPTQDGDGVNIRRVADFNFLAFDPFLMIDELKSDDEQDFIGGFPPHPHRGIETFTYILKGGFEHQDQMGNKKAIKAGDVQWMSTGYGVIHSEMPLADSKEG